jgi:1-acyl-sn-glycerol-3-phosphate acyltransferase
MDLHRSQQPYEFCPPKYAAWFQPVMHLLAAVLLRYQFNVRRITVRGAEALARLAQGGQSVLVAPNHADHADPSLLVHAGRRHGVAFHFMAAREAFELSRFRRFVLQRSGAFSVDREGADLAAVRTAMNLLREGRHPLVIFPEGEIYHHHEELDRLNEGVATILLRAAEKLPEGRRSHVVPTAIRITHDASVAATFSPRLDALERSITWKPQRGLGAVERIYRLGGALVSIKEAEYMGASRQGPLVERIQELQGYLVDQVERGHGMPSGSGPIPARIKALRHLIRRELLNDPRSLTAERTGSLYDDLDRLFAAQQLYSYPGQYLRQHPTLDRIAETLFKLEEDVLGRGTYPAPRRAEILFGNRSTWRLSCSPPKWKPSPVSAP